ncbi:MAG: alpha/beta hydrolase [Oceanospirillaceae bacterium]|nr:alpha/beta hydrolase [Oceanospirillaceae bacterium]
MKKFFPEDFYARAIAMTGDKSLVEITTEKLGNIHNPAWVSTWENIANTYAEKAKITDETGNLRKSCAALSIACYPCLWDNERNQAYQTVKKLYDRIQQQKGYTVIRNTIMFDGYAIPYALRLAEKNPKNVTILLLRGLDSFKEVMYFDDSLLLEQGYNILAIDFPGMGENPHPLNQRCEVLFSTAIKSVFTAGHIRSPDYVTIGLGFGGYYAACLAASDPHSLGAVTLGAPLHYGFKPKLSRIIFHYQEISFLQKMLKHSLQNMSSVRGFISTLSLKKRGLLTQKSKPIFYINGALDLTVSNNEAQFLNTQGEQHRTLILQDAGHLGVEKIESLFKDEIVPWLNNLTTRPGVK